MADVLQKLAPPIAPPQPVEAAASGWGDAAIGATLLLLVVLAVAWLAWRHGIPAWKRWRLRKELAALPDGPNAPAVAQRLVVLVRKHRLQPADAWWQAVDSIRFRQPSDGGMLLLAELKSQLLVAGGKRD